MSATWIAPQIDRARVSCAQRVTYGSSVFDGRTLGKYDLIAEIARGGMGVVYLALSQGAGGFNKLVVLKELQAELVEDPSFLRMFLDEARLAARLNHANIVQTYEVGRDGERHYMVMPYLEGRSYDQVRRRSRRAHDIFALRYHLKLFCDVLEGLAYAHELRDFDGSPLHVVHRDISPNNVFVTFDGEVKLLDFGIAKAADHSHETQAGVLKGKLAYMSPEQARGLPVDARADVFSVGVMLWEAIAGRRMRAGGRDEVVQALGTGATPSLADVAPHVAPELATIVARAIEHDREARYGSAADLQADLERYLATLGPIPKPRELAGAMQQMFAEEREKTRALVEAHIARARSGSATDVDLPVISIQGSGAPRPSGEISAPGGGSHSHSFGPATPLPSNPAPQPETPPIPPAPRARRRWLPVVVAGVAIAGGAAAAVSAGAFGERARRPASAVVTPPAPPSPASERPTINAAAAVPATASEPRVPTLELVIAVTPASATIRIDGALVSGNPFAGRYRADGLMHRIHVSAPRRQAVTRDVAFTKDLRLDIALPPATTTAATRNARKPVAPPPAPAAAAPPPAPRVEPEPPKPSPPKPTDIDPSGGQKPRRAIDPTNPYGTP